ncbi:MAG: clostripain-related cysteine peptidase [Myxococcaceae bacterium]
MAGENDLEASVKNDLEKELSVLGSNKDIQVLAFSDRKKGALLFRVNQSMRDNARNAIVELGKQNTGNPQTLLQFVRWSKTNYPAEHYLLSFWGHGSGNKAMYDQGSDDSITNDELLGVLPDIGFIDVVAYDACYMARINTAKLWHNHATAISFSQESVSWNGIAYDKVIEDLRTNPDMSADDVARSLTRSTRGLENSWSAIAVDKRFEIFNSAFENWLQSTTDKKQKRVRQIEPNIRDLYQLAALSHNKASVQLIAAYNGIKLYEQHSKKYKGLHGLSTEIPVNLQKP